MKRLAVVTVVLALAATARAEDKAKPAGTWKWSVERNGQTFENTLTLKLDGDKLTGTIKRNDQETKIEDGKVKDGEVTFTVTRERNGQKFTMKYKGKVDGDIMKGKTEFEINGETMSRDWEAKRSKD